MHARLTIFLNTNSIPFEKHFGFRHSHSTTHAIIKITEKNKQDCDMLVKYFLTYKKCSLTFDTINHDILLRKLDYYGIRGIINNWFHSYSQNRMQFTSVNGYQSDMRISFRPFTLYFAH